MGTAERRLAELQHAQVSLRAEWAYWTAEAARPPAAGGVTLQKHQSQIDSVIRTLGAALENVHAAALGAQAEGILDLHHIWDFFRAKLALRYIEFLRPFLDTADELAWAIYHPAIVSAGGRQPVLREPPLVFLDRGAVPFASARGSNYRDLLPHGVRTRTGADASSVLPFPVIGVPWYLTGHLPGVLLVAHEVGHHIEDDCVLAPALSGRIAASGLPALRVTEWQRWQGEVFADVVASLACGAAYAAVLADALAANPAEGAGMQAYPPPAARLRVCLEAISQAGLPGARDLVAASGCGTGPGSWEQEARAVVDAFLGQPYRELGDQTLAAVLTSPAVADAADGARRLLAGAGSSLLDVRAILAAAALAFVHSPEGYDGLFVGGRAIKEVLAQRPAGPRLGAAPAARADRDQSAGLELARLLTSRPAEPSPAGRSQRPGTGPG